MMQNGSDDWWFKRSPFGQQWYAMVCLPTVGCNTLQLFGYDILHVLVRITRRPHLSLSPQVDSNKPAALSGPRPQGVPNIRPEKAASCKLSLSRLMVLQDPSSLKAGWEYMAVILGCTCSSGIKNMWYKQLEAPDLQKPCTYSWRGLLCIYIYIYMHVYIYTYICSGLLHDISMMVVKRCLHGKIKWQIMAAMKSSSAVKHAP